ncbi:MAG TPA: PilN domain-containing protein [Rhodanobacteraceae bacterium]
MARINLLPWRAERREQRKREFFMQLGIAAAAAIAVVVLAILFMDARIASQNSDNDYLTGEIKQLDAKIAEIKDLQKTKSQLLARKQIIEKLQENRAQMVHLFDELVKTIPDGARLTSLKQNGPTLTLDGVAQSNATVAEYMRNIEASPWLGSTDLVKTENKRSDSRTPYEFELVVHLDKPKTTESGAPASGSSSEMAAEASSSADAASASTAAAAPAAPASNGGAAQ